MPESTFRLLIIGAGQITRLAHLPAAIASPFIEVASMVDPDIARAKALCADYGIRADVAESIDVLGASFDGAIVATPNDLHAAVAIALLEKKIPVLVEKPLATSVEEAEAVAEAAYRHDTVCAVGYHTRHSGACRALQQAVTSQRFGKAQAFAHQDGSRGGWSPLSGYNLDIRRAGGGVLVSTGTHFLDRLLWLWGEPDTLSLVDNARGGPESHCIARFGYQSPTALEGSAIFSKLVNLAENTVVETSEGVLIMASDADESVVFRPHQDASLEYTVRERGPLDPRGLYQRQLEDFALACLNHTAPCVSAETGVQSVRLVQALYAGCQPLDSVEAAVA